MHNNSWHSKAWCQSLDPNSRDARLKTQNKYAISAMRETCVCMWPWLHYHITMSFLWYSVKYAGSMQIVAWQSLSIKLCFVLHHLMEESCLSADIVQKRVLKRGAGPASDSSVMSQGFKTLELLLTDRAWVRSCTVRPAGACHEAAPWGLVSARLTAGLGGALNCC